MYTKQTFKPAFSLLELVFVIVILGIVASLGSELIAKIYESYVLQRAQHRSSIKTELVASGNTPIKIIITKTKEFIFFH